VARDASPVVVAVVGSPRRRGNTAFAVRLACQELERLGIRTDTILLVDHDVRPCTGHDDCGRRVCCPIKDDAEELLEKMYAADGLILASPTYFSNMSGQMKVFLDRTNDRYLRNEWLHPSAIGLITVGGQGGLEDTLAALRRVLRHIAPAAPPPVTASGIADRIGDAERSVPLCDAVRNMAGQMAASLK
jgi:multimeric flavodoxin WrbA